MGMSKSLKNPELPPGAIVETYEDGGALRNDGVTLTPASQNPWYVLATVAGEQEESSLLDIDDELHAKNRRVWNGWMCQGMAEGERAALADKLGLPEEDLRPLSAEEKAEVKARFEAAFPDRSPKEMIPAPDATVDFRRVHFSSMLLLRRCHFTRCAVFKDAHFSRTAHFQKAHFTKYADFRAVHVTGSANFQQARFSGDANFEKTYFTGRADFRKAHFIKVAYFENVHFTGRANFEKAQFAGRADFRAAHFTWPTDFQAAHFNGEAFFRAAHFTWPADFRDAHFTGYADFQAARFHEYTNFSDGCFKAKTIFDGATFKGEVPQFFHREMHQDTGFSDDPKLWPEVTALNAKAGKRAYTRLRQVAAEIYDPDLEHFFLRQEMRCKARIEWDKGAWFHWLFFVLYRWIADSGISVARPFWLLVFAWAFGLACFAGHFDSGVLPEMPEDIQDSRYWAAAGVSFGNLFGFLGINRLYFTDLLRDHSPDGLQFVAGAQTVAGVVLLFFLGLGLRNRFRLK